MGRDQHDPALVPQLPQQLHDLILGLYIDAGEGLIQQDNLAVLGQGAGEEHALALTAGKLADLPLPVIQHVHPRQSLFDRLMIRCGGAAQKAHMTVTAHHHHILDQHREAPVDILGLRHIGDQALAHGFPDGPAEQSDFALRRGHEAHDGLEQGGFPGAIDPDQCCDGAARDLETGVMESRLAVAIGHGHVVGKDAAGAVVISAGSVLLIWAGGHDLKIRGQFAVAAVRPSATVLAVTVRRSR